MQIFLLIGLSSLAGALLFGLGALAGFLLATRSIKFAATAQPPKIMQPEEPKPATPRPGGPVPLPPSPPDSGPVKVMQPEDYEAEKMEPMRRTIGRLIGVPEFRDPRKKP